MKEKVGKEKRGSNLILVKDEKAYSRIFPTRILAWYLKEE